MALYFETKIRFDKTLENGSTKRVTEHYIVDALSFTEAEARIIEEQQPYISGNFTVSAVKKSNIAEIFNLNGAEDRWYRCKLNFISIDEKTAQEKKSAHNILVRASDFEDALTTLKDGMKGTIADYEIASIIETNIIYVYPSTTNDNK